ncbi:MAG: hypothetical protein J1D87_11835 [Lachnospiraceae bacterium]|nr:hypothetical protein [Lachnospiraceae bacterium]
MELRRSFNEDAVNYDTYRPEYPNELFEDIISYSQIGQGSNLIEIGVGTGQATLPFIQLGCNSGIIRFLDVRMIRAIWQRENL